MGAKFSRSLVLFVPRSPHIVVKIEPKLQLSNKLLRGEEESGQQVSFGVATVDMDARELFMNQFTSQYRLISNKPSAPCTPATPKTSADSASLKTHGKKKRWYPNFQDYQPKLNQNYNSLKSFIQGWRVSAVANLLPWVPRPLQRLKLSRRYEHHSS